MKISLAESEPIDTYPYLEIGSNVQDNSQPILLHKMLPIYRGAFHSEQAEVDMLIIGSDLQGAIEAQGVIKLLGEELPAYLKLLIEVELKEKEDPKIGVLLCGDLYTSLEKRGSSGDVRNVWKKFKEQFDWVVGVAGNHDRFGDQEGKGQFKSTLDQHLLHQDIIEKANLKIGGISGIIGRSDKVNRVEEKVYLNSMQRLLNQGLDILLLHETPDFPELGLIGNPKIRKVIEHGPASTVFCGHCYWEQTLVEFENRSSVMNVDSKVVILQKK